MFTLIKNWFEYHWVIDDNIVRFFRLNNNLKIPCNSSSLFRVMEDFVERYENVVMAWPNYFFFAPRKTKQPPFVKNTRIYSCNLIRNDIKYRWRWRYNEDTILSIDILKAWYCTIQFNAFLQDKMATQVLKWWNSDEFYLKEWRKWEWQKYADTWTIAKSKMIVNVHPDISELVYKFSRIHHKVDYTIFKNIKLKKKQDLNIKKWINNYWMQFKG